MSAVSTVDVDLPKEIFDVQVNIPLIHQVVVAQQAAARQGTHDTKSRGEVSGGGKKPYRQKGTGRARQGSIRAPQYVGGGTVHGPTPRSYDQKVPKKMKAAALRGALSDRARTGRLHVVETFGIDGAPSTKAAVAALQSLTTRNRVLVVLDRDDQVTLKSLRNVPNLHLLPVDQLNTYDVIKSDDVVFTKAAYDLFVTTRATSGGETFKLSAAVVDSEAPQAAAPKKAAAKKAPAKKAAAKAETTDSTETDATEEDAK